MSKDSVCEERVFQAVHEQHATSLRNFLYYKFGNLEKARDFAQEAFIRLWNNCSKVPFEKTRSYLFTIGNRLFLDDTDHQKVVLKFEKRQNLTESQSTTNPEHLYREEEFKERLEAAISALPEKQREVFLLSRIDKLKNKEIAETLDISIKTVEKHIATSLKTLREKLDELSNLNL
ncbi:RNA polymerase sigma factor [Marinoscillum furvescens]|uniref:RNA polymerase sigma-70 factor (ECF subfamily) n=1 Tax=Marinoscillum furvescens DSM 4134 TaxID=1122208 RepID=A0A3D9KVU1_MARFU|nr:sigma-70 family RNA polymerase sigma factor [Marinoscillum furvescens]RED91495.1 RNA polymerase sigma-70 factor (ECF subfamily) [Marinoscillum furvescens DSM 4134]